MKLVLDNAAAILSCAGIGLLLLTLPTKWKTACTVAGAACLLYAVIMLFTSFSGSASA